MKRILFAAFFSLSSVLFAEVPFKLGVAGYSFSKIGLDRGIDVMRAIDCGYLCHKDFFVAYDASDEKVAAFSKKLSDAGIKCVATGPLYATDEKALRAQFEFAKKLGLKVIVGVPYDLPAGEKDGWNNRIESDRMLDVVDKLVKEYDIRYAIHNHGPDCPKLYPTASAALKRIGQRDRRIGVCLDIGHERRSGSDPIAFIRKHGDRIYDVHVKNIKISAKKNIAKEGPRGELDIPGIFRALSDVGYDGVCHIEYEKDFSDNAMGLAESVGYYRGCMDSIKAKAFAHPVPEGANKLTEQERKDGWKLLWDGSTTKGWVGFKESFKRFPTKGWVMKDGALSMLPLTFIRDDGTRGDMPPEDKKLAGGGDIVTVDKYRSFIFKFDFRMTARCNSGVKYYFDETKNSASSEEYQILDAGHPDFNAGRNGNRRTAALYDIYSAPKAQDMLKPLGQWNSGMIVAKGLKVEHWLNGVKVLEYERGSDDFRKAVAASKYLKWGTESKPWGELDEGRILLQDHGDSFVSFCNLKIKVLAD